MASQPPLRPVFVFPGHLDFYLDDPTTHKLVLTLYNPYDMDITFKVLCNNPKKYAVVEPEGRIFAQKCADIVVRHLSVSPASVLQTDKFRIQIFEDGSAEVAGKRDVLATLHPGSPDPSDSRHSSSLPHPSPAHHSLQSDPTPLYSPVGPEGQAPHHLHHHHHYNYVAIVAAAVCIAALFMPTEGEAAFQHLPYLHLTVNQKLVFAYVLGLVTMAILRVT